MGNFITFRERLQHKVDANPGLTLAFAAQTAIVRKGDSDAGRLLVNMTARPCRVDIMTNGGQQYRKQEWWQLDEHLKRLAGGQ